MTCTNNRKISDGYYDEYCTDDEIEERSIDFYEKRSRDSGDC